MECVSFGKLKDTAVYGKQFAVNNVNGLTHILNSQVSAMHAYNLQAGLFA